MLLVLATRPAKTDAELYVQDRKRLGLRAIIFALSICALAGCWHVGLPDIDADSLKLTTVKARESGGQGQRTEGKQLLYIEVDPQRFKASSTQEVYKLSADGRVLDRVTVKFGAAGPSSIIIEAGLKVGDSIVVSDMSRYDQYDRIHVSR